MVNQYSVGFDQQFGATAVNESSTVNKYIEGLDYKDASEIAKRASELLKENNPNLIELIKDLGGERVVAHTAAAFILTCFEKIYKG